MKHSLTFTAILITCSMVFGQQPASPAKEKMNALSMWPGHWTGTSTYRQGQTVTAATVDEKIEWRVDGYALLINGLGKNNEGQIVHEALGVLSYDPAESRYRLRTWLRDGRASDARFEVIRENNFQWGFDIPQGKIRYSISLTANTWVEKGEFSSDGSQWFPFFDMSLTKQRD